MSISNIKILAEVKISIMTFFLTHPPTPPYLKKPILGFKKPKIKKLRSHSLFELIKIKRLAEVKIVFLTFFLQKSCNFLEAEMGSSLNNFDRINFAKLKNL